LSYLDFDLPRVQLDFHLSLRGDRSLFTDVAPVAISTGLQQFWHNVQPLGLSLITEKARSEFLVAPLLSEVWHQSQRQIALLSGVALNVDASSGLTGTCDFLLCRSSNLYFVSAPAMVTVEAKRDSIPDGLGQCAAEMVGIQRFNQNAGTPTNPVYGCVTTRSAWRFLQLSRSELAIDLDEYSITQPERILEVLLHACALNPINVR